MKYAFLGSFLLLFTTVSVQALASDDRDLDNEVERTGLAVDADEIFWKFIHGEDNIEYTDVVKKLTKAIEKDPQDTYAKAHLGWTKFWSFTEGLVRGLTDGRQAVQNMQAAENAYASAAALAPDEPRILGFLGYTRIALGGTTANADLLMQGQEDVVRSIELWPEWAYFGAAYALSANAPYGSPPFDQAVNFFFVNMDVCANTAIDRNNPDLAPFMALETQTGRDRACWDSWIAPYNAEGFFLIMGDALVKAGKTDVAAVLYNNAKLMEYYSDWPYRDLLERRIENIQENVTNFRQSPAFNQPVDVETTMIVNTGISCAICHQGDADEHYEQPDWIGEHANHYPVPAF